MGVGVGGQVVVSVVFVLFAVPLLQLLNSSGGHVLVGLCLERPGNFYS